VLNFFVYLLITWESIMKKSFTFGSICLLSLLLLVACSSDGSGEAKTILKKQITLTERFVTDTEKADSADKMVAAMEQFTTGMTALIPQLKSFQEKYPQFADKNGQPPKGIEDEIKKLEELSAQLAQSMMKASAYFMDPRVQKALNEMGKAMSELE
jgi:hypothetical protein